jgi:hypothetical protein
MNGIRKIWISTSNYTNINNKIYTNVYNLRKKFIENLYKDDNNKNLFCEESTYSKSYTSGIGITETIIDSQDILDFEVERLINIFAPYDRRFIMYKLQPGVNEWIHVANKNQMTYDKIMKTNNAKRMWQCILTSNILNIEGKEIYVINYLCNVQEKTNKGFQLIEK